MRGGKERKGKNRLLRHLKKSLESVTQEEHVSENCLAHKPYGSHHRLLAHTPSVSVIGMCLSLWPLVVFITLHKHRAIPRLFRSVYKPTIFSFMVVTYPGLTNKSQDVIDLGRGVWTRLDRVNY